MSNIRDQIIEQLNKPVNRTDDWTLYEQLKDCVTIKFTYNDRVDMQLTCKEIDQFSTCRIDEWFRGIIHSLYYRPNHTVLVLEGEQGLGKPLFFTRLVPVLNWHAQGELRETNIVYNNLTFDYEFTKNSLNIPNEDNYIINKFKIDSVSAINYGGYEIDGNLISTDKRLCSYCCTTGKWVYPPRKNFIVLKVVDIDHERLNKINKLDLWIEIFYRFKPAYK